MTEAARRGHADPPPEHRWISGCAAALVIGLLIWLGSRTDAISSGYQFTGESTEYYSLLVDGFRKGQLHMDVEVHPDLLSEDPEVRARAPHLLDANLYNGRYYLYYGVVPAVTLLWPYRAITGHHLGSNAAVLVFLTLGFLCALGVFSAVRRSHFARLPGPVLFSLVLFLGLGSAIPFLAVRGAFYELPIAAGYAFCMAALWCAWLALQGTNRPLLALAGSSLLLSLAVGCRPNYVLALPALLIPASHVYGRLRGEAGRWPASRTLAALLLPSLGIGTGLAWYNHARFGNPFEFGFQYGMNSFFTSGNPLASIRFVWPNLNWYYLSPPSFSPYFPFFYPVAGSFRPMGYHGDEAVHGQLLVTLFAGILALGLVLLPGARAALRQLRWWFALLAWTTIVSLGFMLSLTIRGNRYMVDFHAPLVLGLACLAVIVVCHAGRLRRILAWTVAAGAGAASLTSLGSSVQQFDDVANGRPATFRQLSHVFNYPSYWAYRCGLWSYGPVAFDVIFRETHEARVEPLLVAGTPYYTDGLFVAQHPGNVIQYQLDHHGYGGPSSALLSIEPGRRYRIEVLMGSLFPPELHPYFQPHDPTTVHGVKQAARVVVDGETVIDSRMASYDAPPWTLQYGANSATLKPFGATFSGQIARRPRPAWSLPPAGSTDTGQGLWQLGAQFVPLPPGTREPLLAAGEPGAGVLLLIESLEHGSIRFGLDVWNHGLSFSEPIAIDYNRAYPLNVFLGPVAASQPWPQEWGEAPEELIQQKNTLRVWLDGEPVWTIRVAHYHEKLSVAHLGVNPQGFSTASGESSHALSKRLMLAEDERDSLQRNLSAPPAP